MMRKILLPLDGSYLAGHALQPALQLLPEVEAELLIITVPSYHNLVLTSPGGLGINIPFESEAKSKKVFRTYLENIATNCARPGLKIKTLLLEGDPASHIIDQAAEEEVDLIVMSTHGYSGLKLWQYGSVTQKVMAAAPCPVLAIRGTAEFKHILLPLDGSATAETAIQPAFSAARRLGAKVTMLTVRPARSVDAQTKARLVAERNGDRTAGADGEDPLIKGLQSLRNQLSHPGPEVDVDVVTGPVAETILDYARAKNIDLIVMATHGRSGLQRWLYGSVATKVLQNAEVGVLIVRPETELLRVQ